MSARTHTVVQQAPSSSPVPPQELVMIPKASNSMGLQIADLVARSVGIKVLRPTQPNRAYDIVAKMFP
jgi:hypothetical protein